MSNRKSRFEGNRLERSGAGRRVSLSRRRHKRGGITRADSLGNLDPEYAKLWSQDEAVSQDVFRGTTHHETVRQQEIANKPGNQVINELKELNKTINVISSISRLSRGHVSRTVSVGTVATLVLKSIYPRGYILVNPASTLSTDVASTSTQLASAVRTGTGNTQATPLGVANFREMHLVLNITAIDAVTDLSIVNQILDPVTGTAWADGQFVFDTKTAIGTFYAQLSTNGVAVQSAFRWVITGGNVTFSLGVILKDNLPGTSTGLVRTISLGGPGVTTVSGYPLLEGTEREFNPRENVEIYAVPGTALTLRVWEL